MNKNYKFENVKKKTSTFSPSYGLNYILKNVILKDTQEHNIAMRILYSAQYSIYTSMLMLHLTLAEWEERKFVRHGNGYHQTKTA